MAAKKRCKFVVSDITQNENSNGYKNRLVKMAPVFSDDPESENKQFWDATPSGEFWVSVTNDSMDDVEVGQEFYLDMIPCSVLSPV